MRRLSEKIRQEDCSYCRQSGIKITAIEPRQGGLRVVVMCPWCRGVDMLILEEP